MLTATNSKKMLFSALLVVFFCASFISLAFAAPDEQDPAIDSSATSDGQLIAPAPEEEQTTTSEGNPVLIQERDADANATDSSETPTGEAEDRQNLIAANTGSDNNSLAAGVVALVGVFGLGASVAVVRHRDR
jgi:hypothetical protein